MQDISNELKKSLEKKNPVYKKVVELYRKLWINGSFVYDTAIDITSEVKEMSEIRWKMDAEGFNVWTLDNTSIVFRNDRNQWKQGNEKGFFSGNYQVVDSKIVIKFGAQLADGSFELLKSFTGYISDDLNYDLVNKTCNIVIQSGVSKFSNKNAETISTLVNDELVGQDSGAEFTTDNNGVGIIINIKRGTTLETATEIKPQIDYTISDLNQKSLPLKITLISELTAGEKLYCSYRYWYQDKTLEWLVEQIMILNGITNYDISPAIFSSSIENTWDFNSKDDWDTCTKTNIDTITTPGSFKIGLIDDFGDGNYDENPEWTVKYDGWEVDENTLVNSLGLDNNPNLFLPLQKTTGNWIFKAWSYSSIPLTVWVIGLNETGINGEPNDGYYIIINPTPTGVVVRLFKRTAGVDTLLIDTSYLYYRSIKLVYRISRDENGVFKLYINEVLKGTATDTTHNTTNGFYLIPYAAYWSDYTRIFYFDDFYFWDDGTTVGKGVLESPVKDCGSDVTAYGNLNAIYTANGANIIFETYSSDSADFSTGNDPAGWVAIGATGLINSAVKRYLKFRVTATLESLTNPVTPVFDEIKLTYYTSTTLIDLVNLTGMTSRQALEKLAEMPAYEFGFKADETFIYRPRFTNVPAVMELRSDNNIVDVKSIDLGIDRVYNRVVAEFGIYRKVSDASSDEHPNSIDKYGDRQYSISSSSLLPADNVNLAYAVAPTILNYTKEPKIRCKVESMFLPHLELGDKVKVFFDEPLVLRRWKWGDTDVVYGQPDLEYYDDEDLENRYNMWDKDFRIEGITLSPNDYMTTLDLVEV